MQFKEFQKLIKEQFNIVSKNQLFVSSLTGHKLWDIYIESFKPEDNPIFRDPESSTHNDNLDKSFIRRYGNIVGIDENYEIITMWDIDLPKDNEYYLSCKEMSKALKNAKIADYFLETLDELNSLPYEKCNKTQTSYRLGIETNHKIYTQEEANKFGVVEAGKTYQFFHFNVDLPSAFVDKTGKSQSSLQGELKSAKEVFERGMLSIPLDTLELVRDLINQGSLLDGTTHLWKIEEFIKLQKELKTIKNEKFNEWCWIKAYKLNVAKFRNELIGTLCIDLSEGMEINQACQGWNKKVDPANYMKAKAPITASQIKQAQKFVEEQGYEESFSRRFATIDDISVEEILHSNVGDGKIKNASIFDQVKPAVSTRHKKAEFDKVEEVSIEKFMKDILPTVSNVELFMENRMENNLVALTTANDPNSKKMFKWNNNFSWTFKGNLAGKSQIKEEVKAKGGKIDGVLRFSMMWADKNGDNSDLDLHCIEPNRNEIYFASPYSAKTNGRLDVDITQPNGRLAVENITYPSLNKMIDGTYKLYIQQYSARNSKGFKAEVEFDDQIYSYEYNRPVSRNVQVAEVKLEKGVFTIVHILPETSSSKSLWNLDTNQFHKVNLVSLSPNHWGDNEIGNKHYLFMLDNCKSDESLRSFHVENLNSDLLAHRKTMEVLANTTMLSPANKQLCGLGFNSTVKDEVVLRLKGSHNRVIKVKF